MTSRITIEVDFDNGQPYIKIVNDATSDDVRDKLIKFFTERLGYTSSWCKIDFISYENPIVRKTIWHIHPIRPDQLEKEATIMQEQVDILKKNLEQPSVSH